MASRFASIIEEQILSITETAVLKDTKIWDPCAFEISRLTSFNHQSYHATFCARKSAVWRDFTFLIIVLLEINQILDRLIIQLVYPKTNIHFSVCEMGDIHLHFGE